MSTDSLDLELELDPKGTRRGGLPTVLLRHDLPDGTHHVDWMVARNAAAESPLITFRLPSRLDELPAGGSPLEAERIKDHRPDFLEFQGQLTENRGTVRRLRRGIVTSVHEVGSCEVILDVRWDSLNGITTEQIIEIRRKGPSRWLVVCDSIRESK
jgi:hypothetical protein